MSKTDDMCDFIQSFSARGCLRSLVMCGYLGLSTLSLPLWGNTLQDLTPGWPEATQTARPWTRWWWPGSAVDEANLSAQLQALADVGMGGVEITPIYGAHGFEDRYVDFLSPRWLSLLEHTGREAERLGLGVDMATGTGWPFGGPWVPVEDAAHGLDVVDGELSLKPTGQEVKRAAPGGEGLVLDPYSSEALQRYLTRFDEAFKEFPTQLLRSQFHDSFEYARASFTAALPSVFEEMHGYRLEPYFDDLLGRASTLDPDALGRVKRDYRTVLDHLHQAYLRKWITFAHAHGWKTRNQSHGAPANILDLYSMVDIPETEIYGTTPFAVSGLRRAPEEVRQAPDLPEPLFSRMASSAAHVSGSPLISSETATWLREHWRVTPAFIKPEIDRLFLDGINHIVFHGTAYSPKDVEWPGWFFYASTQFNQQNPLWRDFEGLTAYISRVQSVLQSGKPDNDLLIYWPLDDIWHSVEGLQIQLGVHEPHHVLSTEFGRTVKELHAAAFSFDYISDAQLRNASASEGRIHTPGGSYAALVVPAVKHMETSTLRAILALAESGATVVFESLPADVPGFAHIEVRRDELQQLKQTIKLQPEQENNLHLAAHGEGRIVTGPVLEAVPHIDGVRPEPMMLDGLEFIRRQNSDGWDYFISNMTAERRAGWYPLGVRVKGATLLDPLSGKGGVAALRTHAKSQVEVYLQLESGESLILRTLASSEAQGAAWAWATPLGDPLAIEGPWHLEFIRGGPKLPAPATMEALTSWTESTDAETHRFAGTGRYETTFSIESLVADDWILDLGDVRESARVWVNGRYAGAAWSLPFRLSIGELLREGENTLTIEVTNGAANRIRDLDQRGVDWKIMRNVNILSVHGGLLDASGWKVQPAGLLGPVKLLPMQHIAHD